MKKIIILTVFLGLSIMCFFLAINEKNEIELASQNLSDYRYAILCSTPMRAQYYGDGESCLLLIKDDGSCLETTQKGMEWNNIAILEEEIITHEPDSVVFLKKNSKQSTEEKISGGCFPQASGTLDNGKWFSFLNKGKTKTDKSYMSVLRYGTSSDIYEEQIKNYIYAVGNNKNHIYAIKKHAENEIFYFSDIEIISDNNIEEKEYKLFEEQEASHMPMSNIIIQDDSLFFMIMTISGEKCSLELINFSLKEQHGQNVINRHILETVESGHEQNLYLMNRNSISINGQKVYYIKKDSEVCSFDIERNEIRMEYKLRNNIISSPYQMCTIRNDTIYYLYDLLDDIIIGQYEIKSGKNIANVSVSNIDIKEIENRGMFLSDFKIIP